jgi:nucleotide-binding universal stress UspA family protein
MIVMGAYAHRWIRQAVFGGVTQSLLKESPVPLLTL